MPLAKFAEAEIASCSMRSREGMDSEGILVFSKVRWAPREPSRDAMQRRAIGFSRYVSRFTCAFVPALEASDSATMRSQGVSPPGMFHLEGMLFSRRSGRDKALTRIFSVLVHSHTGCASSTAR